MPFLVQTQSGEEQPNSIKGLLLWLDASEAGTLSRDGTKATKIFDKAPGGYTMSVKYNGSKPKILQSRFNGKTVLRFEDLPQLFVGDPKIENVDNIKILGVVNGTLVVDHQSSITISQDGICIPANNYTGPVDIAEILVYDAAQITMNDIEWLCVYLIDKWSITNHIV